MIAGRRVAAVVCARAGSSRLPNKMLAPFGGRPLLAAVLERLGRVPGLDASVLATTREPGDDPLAAVGAAADIPVHRGATDDVAGRMARAADTIGVGPDDVVLRVCADNPLFMGDVVAEGVERLVAAGADVLTPFRDHSYPFGMSHVAMTGACLARIDAEAVLPIHREHVENFCFDSPASFSVIDHTAPGPLRFEELCLSLDYDVDLARLEWIRAALQDAPKSDSAAGLIALVRGARVAADERAGAPVGLLEALRAEGAEIVAAGQRGAPADLRLVFAATGDAAAARADDPPRGTVFAAAADGVLDVRVQRPGAEPYRIARHSAADAAATARTARLVLAGPARPLEAQKLAGSKSALAEAEVPA